MFRRTFRAALVAGVITTLVGATAVDAHAQWSPSLVVKLGATLPIGDFADGAGLGYNVGVGAEFTQPVSPVGFRLEVDFHENEFEDSDIKFRQLAGIANLVYQQRTSNLFLIGGAGVYRGYIPNDDGDDPSSTDAGINVGAGFRFPLTGFSTFVEARYHHVFTDGDSRGFIPITFGVKF
jgi:hypothetical protein